MTANEHLGELDPDDPTAPSVQIANAIRAAILTHKLNPGDSLPSQTELAERYGVARETVKRGLAILRDERLIVAQQGGRTRVRAKTQRSVELRPHIEAAFEQSNVTIDFAGFSSETLRGAISEPLDKIRTGRFTPESVTLRLLITDQSQPTVIPALVDREGDPEKIRARSQRITARAVGGVVDQVNELSELGLVPSATVAVRVHSMAPSFKLYILNQSEVFYGFYPVVERSVTLDGDQVGFFDLMGKDVPLFHFATSDGDSSHGAQFVEASSTWFNSVWDTIAQEGRM